MRKVRVKILRESFRNMCVSKLNLAPGKNAWRRYKKAFLGKAVLDTKRPQ